MPLTAKLRRHQAQVARREAEEARRAQDEPEKLAHERRSEKAAYLRDRLAEAEASESDDGTG